MIEAFELKGAELSIVEPTKPISFNRDVRPFLSSTCFQCHGPDSTTREAGLRLDVAESAQADLGGYVAIAAGKPDSSEALRRIFSDDPEKLMPPPASGLKLTQEQKETFRRWIEQGAMYEQHWAFNPVVRPQVPTTTNAKRPIDAFVQARLAEVKLEPSKPASPEKQLRRVTLDLTGLPPIDKSHSCRHQLYRSIQKTGSLLGLHA